MLNYGRILYPFKPVALRLSPHEKAQDAARLPRSIELSPVRLSIAPFFRAGKVAVFAAPGVISAHPSFSSGPEAFCL